MHPTAEILSDGEHPIYLWPTDNDNPKTIPRSEAAESQKLSEIHNDSTPSVTSDEKTPDLSPSGEKSGSAPQRLKPSSPSGSRKHEDNRSVGQARRSLGDDLGSSTQDSRKETWSQRDEAPEPIEFSDSEYTSSLSSYDDDSDLDKDLQVGLAGEQFPNSDSSLPDLNDDSDLEDINGPQTNASAAVVAPFRGDGGLPNIPGVHRQVEDPSEITDFGESLYAKVRKSRSRKSASSGPSRTSGRRRSKKSEGTLQDRLFQALVPTHEGKKEFFPRNALSTIINYQCVYEELSKHLADAHSEQKIAEYAVRICDKTKCEENRVKKTVCFRKIFVILVLIDKTPAITKFLEIGLSDSDLPLELIKRLDKDGSKELRLSRDPKKRLKCFSKNWKQLHIRNFEAYQWTTISPFFAKGGYKQVAYYPLQDQAILPFISGKTLEFEGGFSRVSKIDIHPDHHNFDCYNEKEKPRSFAVKRLHSRDKTQFDKEVEMLKRFSDPTVPTHKHLISLLATYRQFGTYFLIFHWADADLRRYRMEVNPTPTMDRETVIWVAQQCKGIAEGVVAIHQYSSSKLRPQPKDEVFGHHGDIKPENVLWFPDPDHEQTKRGTLKLSDFGLAEFSIHHTKSMQRKSKFATSLSYQAPEVDLEGTGAIGRSYDMWTLGCLYLEFITWLMGGWDLVNKFYFDRIPTNLVLSQDATTTFYVPPNFVLGQDATTFYVLKPVKMSDGKWKQMAEIKSAVSELISRLLADASCTDFLRDFIKMVRDDLLVIKTNDPQKRDRATSQQVLTTLGNMAQRCQHSVGYGYKVGSSSERHE